MLSTSPTLLERLRQSDDREAWYRFAGLYTPLLLSWARQRGLSETDAADLVQDVLLVVYRELPTFRYDPSRRFRGWLRTIAINKANEFYRRRSGGDGLTCQLPQDALATPDDEAFWENEYRERLLAQALQVSREAFKELSWRAATELLMNGRSAREVAEELGMTVAAVYQARCRVLRRLRRELKGFWE